MAADIFGDRGLSFGIANSDSTIGWASSADFVEGDPEDFDLSHDDLDDSDFGDQVVDTFDGESFVPVVHRQHAGFKYDKGLVIDTSAVILTGDVDERFLLSPFENTQRDYNGAGSMGRFATYTGFDDNPDELFPDTYEVSDTYEI